MGTIKRKNNPARNAMLAKRAGKKEQELKKVLDTFYVEVNKLEDEYNDLVNELIKRVANRKLKELKKELN